ncbi:hypothetical protein SAY86_006597 [Trapa natans]|uniref:Succinate dehydrogenase subunit 6, mitochondrial n=1 Tax=Trapa natans TaxID=22666 RepID=A0AAN7L7M8_TRANT|nr:hypothetical protein SAY86_006597 [Trapa natans]
MEEDSSADLSYFRRHKEAFKDYWADKNYSRFIKRDKPLPSWSSSDVEEFIASDPIHGPTLKTAREAANYSAVGSVIGAVSTAGFAWKYSKSLHGAGLSFVAGAVFGWTFGQEFANHWLQLYRLDTVAAQVKFLEWWKKKTEGH